MMGRMPYEIDRCTIGQFAAMVAGFSRMNGGKEHDAPTDDEYYAALADEIAAGRA